MALREIRKQGDPILNKECKPVKEMTPRIRELIEDMFETMYEGNGCGLTAPCPVAGALFRNEQHLVALFQLPGTRIGRALFRREPEIPFELMTSETERIPIRRAAMLRNAEAVSAPVAICYSAVIFHASCLATAL